MSGLQGSLKGWNVAILVAIGAIWIGGSTQREKRVVGDTTRTDRVAALEDQAAASPADATRVCELAQSYLDAHASGMAQATIERAPESVRKEPQVEHLYARSLLDQGRSADALAAERRVLARCSDDAAPASTACSTYLIASATRRTDILEQLVALGVEDANAHPEASSLAYHNATRQVSFSSH